MTLAFLNIGTQEMILIVIAILLLFGGKKLPELARGLGRGIREFKDASDGIKREISDQINNFEKDLDVTAEEKPKSSQVNQDNVGTEATDDATISSEDAPEKKAPSFTTPENTYQHNPGEHPVDGTEYYKYGYNDHFATEDEVTTVTPETTDEDIADKPSETKQA